MTLLLILNAALAATVLPAIVGLLAHSIRAERVAAPAQG